MEFIGDALLVQEMRQFAFLVKMFLGFVWVSVLACCFIAVKHYRKNKKLKTELEEIKKEVVS